MTLIEDNQEGQRLWNRQLECEYPVPTIVLPICIQALTIVYRQAEALLDSTYSEACSI